MIWCAHTHCALVCGGEEGTKKIPNYSLKASISKQTPLDNTQPFLSLFLSLSLSLSLTHARARARAQLSRSETCILSHPPHHTHCITPTRFLHEKELVASVEMWKNTSVWARSYQMCTFLQGICRCVLVCVLCAWCVCVQGEGWGGSRQHARAHAMHNTQVTKATRTWCVCPPPRSISCHGSLVCRSSGRRGWYRVGYCHAMPCPRTHNNTSPTTNNQQLTATM